MQPLTTASLLHQNTYHQSKISNISLGQEIALPLSSNTLFLFEPIGNSRETLERGPELPLMNQNTPTNRTEVLFSQLVAQAHRQAYIHRREFTCDNSNCNYHSNCTYLSWGQVNKQKRLRCLFSILAILHLSLHGSCRCGSAM